MLHDDAAEESFTVQNNTTAAREAITAAVASPYGARSGDYMATLAKVHCGCREWQVPGALSVTV